MRVMVIGGGGREHALVWKLASSSRIASREDLFCVPGNGGIEPIARCLPAPAGGLADVSALADMAQEHRVDFTVVGPELPLTHGLADELASRGLACSGASRAAARLEASKAFAKQIMARHGIPTARFEVFDDCRAALDHLASPKAAFPIVVKADGLAAGKGVVVAADRPEAEEAVRDMLERGRFGEAGRRVILEECLSGPEASFFALTDGERVVALATCQDYKRARDGDVGPNTGGMGALCPSPRMSVDLESRILAEIVEPTVKAMASEGTPYRGVLYTGVMLTREGPKVLEFNARFGDPETQVLLPRLEGDLLPLLMWSAGLERGRTGEPPRPAWRREAACCVVMASKGYPEASESGRPIRGLSDASGLPATVVFHAATRSGRDEAGRLTLVTAGGRVLAVSALGKDLGEAARRAYAGVERIRFEGMQCRRDIGREAMASS